MVFNMAEVRIKKAVIREDLLSITNDYRKAIILNQFIYWSERVSDADKFIKKENEIAKNNGEEERELFYGWIYKTAEELADEVMLGLSASQIRRYISELVDMGYISKRNNPKYKWDRTLQYRVNLVNIAKDLRKNGYPLSDYKIEIPENEKFNAHECAINNEPMKNQTQVSDEAIPKNTNIDYLNRDYNSEITGEVHTSVSEKQTARVTRKDMQAKKDDMLYRFFAICDDSIENKTVGEVVKNAFSRYMNLYETYFAKVHPILTDKTLTNVCLSLSNVTDTEHNHFEWTDVYLTDETGLTGLDRMVNEHFRRTHRRETNYSITHFAKSDYLLQLAQGIIEY
jgi:hypothetical protein